MYEVTRYKCSQCECVLSVFEYDHKICYHCGANLDLYPVIPFQDLSPYLSDILKEQNIKSRTYSI